MGSGKTLYINIWNECNLSCFHCFNHEGKTTFSVLGREDIVSIIRMSRMYFRVKTVQLSGGEPTQRPDLDIILTTLLADGFRIRLQTNLMLTDEMMSNLLAYSGEHFELIVSLDGIETHDIIRGKGSSEKVINNLKILSRYFKIRINILLTSMIQWHEIESIAELARRFGMSLAFNPLCPCGRAGKDILMSRNQYFDWMFKLEKLREQGIAVRKGFDIENGFLKETENCPVRKAEAINIAADGSVYPCGFLSGHTSCRMGSAGRSTFEMHFVNLKNNPCVELPQQCKECDYYCNRFCHGGCPARIFSLFGTWNMPDVYCMAEYYNDLII